MEITIEQTDLRPRKAGRRSSGPRLWLAAAAITVAALVLRLVAAWMWNADLPNSPERLTFSDEPGYNELALGLLAGEGMTWPGRVPGYPAWLAAIHGLSGQNYHAVPYVQAFLGAAVVLLTFLLGRRLLGAPTGLVAAVLAATSYILIRQSLHFMSEILFTPVLLIVALILWRAFHEPSTRRFAWAGFWVGISCLIRPTLLLFPLFLVPVLALRFEPRRASRRAAVCGAVTALVIMPWMVRNYMRYDAILPLATSNAILWQGSPEYYRLIHDEGYTYMQIWTEVLYPPDSDVPYPGSIEGESYWRNRALRSIASDPLTYLRYTVEKLGTYWVGDPNADWGDTHIFNYRALRAWGFSRTETMLLMLARALPILALLAAFLLRRRWRELLPIYALLLYSTLLHAATHAEARLSEPLHPFVLILVAGGGVHVWNSLRSNVQEAQRAEGSAVS